MTSNMNYGKLKGDVTDSKNIVYYRRGLDELSLNITNACPNACGFCIRDRDAGWGVSNLYLAKDPTVDEIMTAYEDAKKTNAPTSIKKVKICGYGEPILRFEDIKTLAEQIRKNGETQDIQVTTTGWPYFKFISPDVKKIGELRTAGVSHIYLSMNAIDEQQYNRLVKPGVDQLEHMAFADALRFGKGARDAGLDVTLGFILLGGITEEQARTFAEKHDLKYRMRAFED